MLGSSRTAQKALQQPAITSSENVSESGGLRRPRFLHLPSAHSKKGVPLPTMQFRLPFMTAVHLKATPIATQVHISGTHDL